MKSWPKVKLLFAPIWFYLPLFGPKIQFLSIFSLTYLYLPLFYNIWLYFGLITLIWAYLSLIALILPYMPYSPYICILLLRLHLCAKFYSNRTITYGDIAFWRFGGYKCRQRMQWRGGGGIWSNEIKCSRKGSRKIKWNICYHGKQDKLLTKYDLKFVHASCRMYRCSHQPDGCLVKTNTGLINVDTINNILRKVV